MKRPARIALIVVAVIAAVVLLFTVVFPRLVELQDDPSLGAPASAVVGVA